MTATNHAITAANMALLTRQWWVLPLALLSHFVLDSMPHYGEPVIEAKDKRFKLILGVDSITLCMISLLIILTAGQYTLLVVLSMLLAISPDFVWAYRLILEKKRGCRPSRNKLTTFHAKIQWGERPWGWLVELFWLIFMIILYGYLVMKYVAS